MLFEWGWMEVKLEESLVTISGLWSSDGLLLWLLGGSHWPERRWVSKKYPYTFTQSLSYPEHWNYGFCSQDRRRAGWSSPLHGERDGEQTPRSGEGVPVPADGPAHFLQTCCPHRHTHLWALRHGYSTPGRHQPRWIQWYAERMKDRRKGRRKGKTRLKGIWARWNSSEKQKYARWGRQQRGKEKGERYGDEKNSHSPFIYLVCQCMNLFPLCLSAHMGLVCSGKPDDRRIFFCVSRASWAVLSLTEEILSDAAARENLKLFSQSGSAAMKGCLCELVSSCDDKG